jgi:hypothetical protein
MRDAIAAPPKRVSPLVLVGNSTIAFPAPNTR